MGGDLTARPGGTPKATVPTFAVHALRDPNSAPLQRIQIIKGWTKNGEMYEQGLRRRLLGRRQGRSQDPSLPGQRRDGGHQDLRDLQGQGRRRAAATWTDPDFDMTVPAFYYVRVLENPVCRWSTRDANGSA